jgi:hypothetical protein
MNEVCDRCGDLGSGRSPRAAGAGNGRRQHVIKTSGQPSRQPTRTDLWALTGTPVHYKSR